MGNSSEVWWGTGKGELAPLPARAHAIGFFCQDGWGPAVAKREKVRFRLN
jgi:hypothetical protein